MLAIFIFETASNLNNKNVTEGVAHTQRGQDHQHLE